MDKFAQYEVTPSPLFQNAWRYGDGYDLIEVAESRGWRVQADWGKAEGYNLGSWPLIIVFFGRVSNLYHLVYYVEGDITQYAFPTKELRAACTDEIAFFHWKHQGEEWVAEYETVDQLPEELRGPYRR
jgi:hypothetical protein